MCVGVCVCIYIYIYIYLEDPSMSYLPITIIPIRMRNFRIKTRFFS